MKTILITGCSSGYGLETARHFHARGWNVIATMRTPRIDLFEASERMRILALDVTDPDSIALALELAGPIDVNTVTSLRKQLWSAARGGALPLTVDLSEVTHLASTGIALLFEFVEDTATAGREVRLVAPENSPARSAMEVSGLDRVAPVQSR